ncbi:polysaccharide deacetylase family protein [Corallococcus sp. M34]|uniref:polysaccharide deacetylase family protein n=1 Tax=Citreicoccus inhibens TaxID=2849499 RepID=UPI001C21D19F|nr:polysaccharide deacetylase family protein [Citreicoccus inhibens]MBU8895188.1 polysaccharide deacetylase family protein [Citreicoccus inhibens]
MRRIIRRWAMPIAVLGCLLNTASALAATPFNEGMVTITLDDGWATQFTAARPALNARGIHVTYFLITHALSEGWNGYLTVEQVRTLQNEGNELASHTLTHPDLTTLSPSDLTAELHDSRLWLASTFGLASVPAFAPPYGAYNASVLAAIKQEYASSRTVNGGRNFRDTVIYELRGNDVNRNVTVATVRGWIDRAIAEKSWLVLLFHEFTSGTPTRDTQYRTANFIAILDDIRTRNVRTVTMTEGVALTEGRTEPPPSQGRVIYDDALGNGFQDWSWAEHSLDEATTVHSGSAAIRFEPDDWAGLYFHHDGLDLSAYQSIDLWVHGGSTGGQQVRLALLDGTTHLGDIRLDTALGHPIAPGTWAKVSIPLSSMGVSSGTLRDLYLQDDSGTNQGTLYVDDLVLVPR